MKSYKKPVLAVILEEPRDRICSISGQDDTAPDVFLFENTDKDAAV